MCLVNNQRLLVSALKPSVVWEFFSTTVQLFRENILYGIGANAWGFWCSKFSVKMDFTQVHIRRFKCSNALRKSPWKGGSRKLALPILNLYVGCFFVQKGLLVGPICYMQYTLLFPVCTYDETVLC